MIIYCTLQLAIHVIKMNMSNYTNKEQTQNWTALLVLLLIVMIGPPHLVTSLAAAHSVISVGVTLCHACPRYYQLIVRCPLLSKTGRSCCLFYDHALATAFVLISLFSIGSYFH